MVVTEYVETGAERLSDIQLDMSGRQYVCGMSCIVGCEWEDL